MGGGEISGVLERSALAVPEARAVFLSVKFLVSERQYFRRARALLRRLSSFLLKVLFEA